MTVIPRDTTILTVDGSVARYLACPAGAQITVANSGNTLYYKTTSSVTSSSNDGSIATAASASFTSGQFVICATGVATNVIVTTAESEDGNLRIGGNLAVAGTTTATGAQTFTGAATFTGGVTPTSSLIGTGVLRTWPPVAATSGTDTAFANGTLFLAPIFVPFNTTATGLGYLLGSTGGTDKVVVNLWSAAGTNLAQSTATGSGTTAGTAAQTQEIAFTATYPLVGGTTYWVGVAANGNNAKLRTIPIYTNVGGLAGSVAQTHAATTAIVIPTTFTDAKGPVAYIY